MAFGAPEASLDCGFTPNGIDCEWGGADEGDQVSGDGWADLREDGNLEGEISYHNGNETTFIAAHDSLFQQPTNATSARSRDHPCPKPRRTRSAR
jgi:hypothetical protein